MLVYSKYHTINSIVYRSKQNITQRHLYYSNLIHKTLNLEEIH